MSAILGSGGSVIIDSTSFALTNVRIGLPPLIVAGFGVAVAVILVGLILAKDRGTPDMTRIQDAIAEGAEAFLHLEYKWLSVMAGALLILICVAVNWRTGICYICGAATSATCGYIGMKICVAANARTTQAANDGLNAALRVSFNAGCVMGLCVVSFGLGVISVLLMAFDSEAINNTGALAGFGMGASTVSIFARVGGGIFTKAADVGADLVGKNISEIPEDSPLNPATIADNVGDNVGDVAGMGADLFSSFVGSCIASSLLGVKAIGQAGIALPFWICMSGIVAALIGMLFVRCDEQATQGDLLTVLRRAMFIAGIIQIGFVAIIVNTLNISWQYFAVLVIGLAAGLTIGIISEYFTSYAFPPTQGIAESARITAANVIIEGLAVGMYSTIAPTLIVAGVIIAALALAGPFGIALASTGLLSTLGLTLATDAYGPVADNAGGIAEMTDKEHIRVITDTLDALGNTTAAIGKGFAVGSAVLTAVSLLTTFVNRVDLKVDAIENQRFIAGVLIGAMLPYWFGAMTMGAVNIAAQSVVREVIRQWTTIPGLREGTTRPHYGVCVEMITRGALHAMVFPVFLVIFSPLILGIGLGPAHLAGVVLGAIVSGFMLGAMMAAAGGAWDNAKKYIEAGKLEGEKKKSNAHKAAVVGDTVGDPFKDTSGPAINILIKLMSYITVVLSPVFKNQADYWWASLILIGILLVFVPAWRHYGPAILGTTGGGDAEAGTGKFLGNAADEKKGEMSAKVSPTGAPATLSSAPPASVPSSSGAPAAHWFPENKTNH